MAAEALRNYPEPGPTAEKSADSGWWFSVAAFILTVLLVMFAPQLTGPWDERTLRATSLAAASFVVVFLTRFILRRFAGLRGRWRKGRLYDGLYEIAASAERKHQASQDLIKNLLPIASLYLGISASVYNGKLIVEFSRRGRRNMPTVGTKLYLLDCENGSAVGTFKVTQSDGGNCQAIDEGNLDPIFRGYAIQQAGKFLPGDYALLVVPEEDNGNG